MLIRQPGTVVSMTTAIADVKMATADAKRLMKWAEDRGAENAEDARKEAASMAGVGHGTIENLLRKRVKTVAGWVRDRLRDAVIRGLQLEIQRLTHELEMARRSSARPDDDEILAAEAALETARALLKSGA